MTAIDQAELNSRLLCGKGHHHWSSTSGHLIVGFEVIEEIWEGKPTPSGWDNVERVNVVGSFASIDDAHTCEERLRAANRPNRSYDIRPIQVKSPRV